MKCTHTVWQMRMIWNGLHLENPARSVTLSHFQALSCYIFMNLFFPLIRESISEAIKRKLSNRDYKMKKKWGSRWKSHMTTWMCGSNDVYILEFFQYVSQHSHLKYWNWNEYNIKIHENNLQMSCLQIKAWNKQKYRYFSFENILKWWLSLEVTI
jgi:hypothetical protein